MTTPGVVVLLTILDGKTFGISDAEGFVFLIADFRYLSCNRFLRSFGELLEFFFVVSKKIDIISERMAAKWPCSDGH